MSGDGGRLGRNRRNGDGAKPGWADNARLPELRLAYSEHTGYYEISYATASGGPFTVYGQTADKTVSSATVVLPPRSTPYYFRLRTITEPHCCDANRD